jgi:hypothetical protein
MRLVKRLVLCAVMRRRAARLCQRELGAVLHGGMKDLHDSRHPGIGLRPRLALGRIRTANVGQAAVPGHHCARLAGPELADCATVRRTEDTVVGRAGSVTGLGLAAGGEFCRSIGRD